MTSEDPVRAESEITFQVEGNTCKNFYRKLVRDTNLTIRQFVSELWGEDRWEIVRRLHGKAFTMRLSFGMYLWVAYQSEVDKSYDQAGKEKIRNPSPVWIVKSSLWRILQESGQGLL